MSLNCKKDNFTEKDCELVSHVKPKNSTPINEDFVLKLRSKCIYIGKVKNFSTCVEVHNDRIVFLNIHNKSISNKYIITIPYNEILALRYCFCSDISIFVIQPIFDSYLKLSNWVKDSNDEAVNRNIPENFIMIDFEESIEQNKMTEIYNKAKECNSTIKIIEINSVFAESYLNMPNKINTSRNSVNSKKKFPIKVVEEVIHLDDEDDSPITNNDKRKDLLNSAILRYPENESNPIILYGHDLNCLRDGQYLNDNIMNFYLKYYQYNGNGLSQDIFDKIHIYDALFSTHLLNQSYRKRRFSLNSNFTLYLLDSLEKTYHSVLKKWTKDIDIFSKDFLIMPLVKDSHWFLIILCYIGNVISDKLGVVSNINRIKNKPTIVFMDSLSTNIPRHDICKTIFIYLTLELKEKRGLSITINQECFREIYPKVPQQRNYYDCGLFVLEYIERFLKSPEEIYNEICEDSKVKQHWFDPKILNTKRAKIRQTILNMLPPAEAADLESELVKINLDNLV